MKKIKNLFGTPKKAVLTAVGIIAVCAAVGAGGVFAAEAVAESTSIGVENAKNFACADAGIDPNTISDVHIEFDYERGQFVYEVEFTADHTEYEYWIKADDGTVVKKNMELADGYEGMVPAAAVPAVTEPSDPAGSAKQWISLDQAEEKAFADAGVTASEVRTAKAEFDFDDGRAVYEIKFETAEYEYKYEIDAEKGTILTKKKESHDDGKSAAIPPASVQTGSYIGVDKAKEICAAHAGLTVGEVSFSKAKLDDEHGQKVYEIEFYKGKTEYEYEVNALTGEILEFDVED